MIRRMDLAPLDGITKAVFRRVWARRFGGADRLYIPFFSPTGQHILTDRDRRELDPAVQGVPQAVLIPQVMTCRAEDFLWAAELLADMGYREANLNLGCPSGTVAAKGKGAGFLARPGDLARFFDAVFARVRLPVSVKTRLGVSAPEEFDRLLEIFNRYPLASLTVHARVREEKYRGPLHPGAFAKALAESRNPVCCNGDLRTVAGVRAFEAQFPAAESVMIGRGAVADPALLRKLRGGRAASREELRSFTGELYEAYQDFYGHAEPAAQRMKEVWFYLCHLFEGGERADKKLRRTRGPRAYEAWEAAAWAELELRREARGDFV